MTDKCILNKKTIFNARARTNENSHKSQLISHKLLFAFVLLVAMAALGTIGAASCPNNICLNNTNYSIAVYNVSANSIALHTGLSCNLDLWKNGGVIAENYSMSAVLNEYRWRVNNSAPADNRNPYDVYINCSGNGTLWFNDAFYVVNSTQYETLQDINVTVFSINNTLQQFQTGYFDRWNTTFFYWNGTTFVQFGTNFTKIQNNFETVQSNFSLVYDYFNCTISNSQICGRLLDINSTLYRFYNNQTSAYNIFVGIVKYPQYQGNVTYIHVWATDWLNRLVAMDQLNTTLIDTGDTEIDSQVTNATSTGFYKYNYTFADNATKGIYWLRVNATKNGIYMVYEQPLRLVKAGQFDLSITDVTSPVCMAGTVSFKITIINNGDESIDVPFQYWLGRGSQELTARSSETVFVGGSGSGSNIFTATRTLQTDLWERGYYSVKAFLVDENIESSQVFLLQDCAGMIIRQTSVEGLFMNRVIMPHEVRIGARIIEINSLHVLIFVFIVLTLISKAMWNEFHVVPVFVISIISWLAFLGMP